MPEGSWRTGGACGAYKGAEVSIGSRGGWRTYGALLSLLGELGRQQEMPRVPIWGFGDSSGVALSERGSMAPRRPRCLCEKTVFPLGGLKVG